jgi:predicted phosphohydrolase
METFKFQLFSDIHSEFYNTSVYKTLLKIPKLADYLILAGDIGNLDTPIYKEFFDYCSDNWKKVFYILGNHEYYNSNKPFIRLNEDYHIFIRQYPNVFLLDNSHYDVHYNLRIIGSTLWSNPVFNQTSFKIKEINNNINKKLKITDENFRELHKESVNYLTSEIVKNDKNLLVITHFPPTQKNSSHPKWKNEPQIVKDYVASNIVNDLPKNHKIKRWIFGHTHFSTSIELDNIRLLSNQMGYPDEKDINMKKDGVFEIKL